MSLSINDPNLRSWVDIPEHSDFPIQNLPFGIYSTGDTPRRVCTAIGDYVADIHILSEHGFFEDLELESGIFEQATLNPFIGQGLSKTRAVRQRLADIMDDDLEEWDASELRSFFLIPRSEVTLHLPLAIGDYTDFYSSLEHATNVGSLFRGKDNALMPNWRHLPVGYHGRSSSIVVSGTDIVHPRGQYIPEGANRPVFGPSQRLDFELETAFVVGRRSAMGQPISTDEANDYMFGMVLFNDWSARDIQRWEYQPLGPFLGKSFASAISPWVVTMDALSSFRCDGPTQEPEVLPYLKLPDSSSYDIHLEAILETADGKRMSLCQTNHKHLYWRMVQQLAHQTSNGCNVRIGDLYASGTISGPDPGSFGSLLELTQNGTLPITLPDGSGRTFLEDGDTIILKGYCEGNGIRIGFGECRSTIVAT
jgi:fumarylacetoacetase